MGTSSKKLIHFSLSVAIIVIVVIVGIVWIFTKNKKQGNLEPTDTVSTTGVTGAETQIKKVFDTVSEKYISAGKINFESYFDIDKLSLYFENEKIYVSNIRDENFGMVKIYDENNKELSDFPLQDFENISWTASAFKPNEKYILKKLENEKTYFFEITIKKDGTYNLKFLCYTDGLTSQIDYGDGYFVEYTEQEMNMGIEPLN